MVRSDAPFGLQGPHAGQGRLFGLLGHQGAALGFALFGQRYRDSGVLTLAPGSRHSRLITA
jgi:hypothetical protein